MSNRALGLLVLVALLWSVYVLTSAGKFHIVDEVSLFAVTESLATRGNVDTNAIAWTQWVNSPGEVLGAFGPDGEVYSKKGPAPAVLAVPWYLLLQTIARFQIGIGLVQGTLLWNGLITAVTAALLWLTTIRLGYRDRAGLVIALLFGLGTIAWPYATHFFGEPLSALSLLLAFYGILSYRVSGKPGWMWLAGVGAGIAVGTVVAHSILLVGLGLYWLIGSHTDLTATDPTVRWRAWRRTLMAGVGLITPLLVVGLLLLAYNFVRFGAFFDTGYHFDRGEGFTAALSAGLWGLLISPYRGVFWHTPLFLTAVFFFPAFWRRHTAEGTVILVLSLLLIGLYSRWWMWWGGFAWGPRFLVPLTPFWIITLAPTIERLTQPTVHPTEVGVQRWRLLLRHLGKSGIALVVITFLSVVVQLLAVSVNYVNYEIRLRSLFPTDWSDPLRFGPPAQRLADWLAGPVFGQFQLWRENFRANTDLAWYRADGTTAYLTLFVGSAAIVTLGLILFNLYQANRPGTAASDTSRLVVWLLPLIPLTVTGVWLGQAASDPHYGTPDQGYRLVLSELCQQLQPTDVIVTIAPFAYQVPMNWMSTLCTEPTPLYGYATDSMTHAEAEQTMVRLLQSYERLWMVTGGLPANDPENSVERWLANVAYEADDRWFGDYRLVRYATPLRLLTGSSTQLDISLGTGSTPQVTLLTTHAPTQIQVGSILPVAIAYQLEEPIDADLHWFVQLLSADGYAVALVDTQPSHGYQTFAGLPVGEVQIERVALQLERTIPPGTYQLIAGLYDPAVAGGQRLLLPNGRDYIELSTVEVLP
ncbi:MAG: hypothetical protein KF832_30225 [Caldilineaceae bacterium]|nr:hypothetical protein [Caldilineaceae bacterium]